MQYSPESQGELFEAIKEPIGQIGRLARIRHKDGRETRKFCLTQDEAVAWLEETMRPLDGDELIIENARRPKDLNCDPYPRQTTHADRVFLYECGIFLHMLSWRDGYYWKARERRESGAPEREFDEQSKRDWEEYEQRRKR